MSQREKTLAVIVGALAAMVLGYYSVTSLALGPSVDLDKKIAAAEQKLADLDRVLAQKPHFIAAWTDLAGRTLATGENEAVTRLGSELNGLATRHNLQKRTIKPQGAVVLDRKTGLKLVRFTMSGETSLKDTVELLHDFYRLPYVLRMRELSLNPKARSNGREVKLTAKVESLLLPETDLAAVVPASDGATEAGLGRLGEGATLAHYAGIHKRNLFAPYEAPKPKPTPRRDPTPKPDPRPRPKPEPPKCQQDADGAKQTIVALLSYWDEVAEEYVEEVVTTGAASRSARGKNVKGASGSETRYRIGDECDGSTLVMVHWRGAVTQCEATGSRYVYELGETLAQRHELTQEDYPEIYRVAMADGDLD